MTAPFDLRPITDTLQQIDNYILAKSTNSDSKLTTDNPHRSLLEGLRSDLYHYDEEKKERILYNLERYVKSHPKEDPELIAVLERVSQVITHFQQTNQILVSPAKPLPPIQYPQLSPNGTERRKLFEGGT